MLLILFSFMQRQACNYFRKFPLYISPLINCLIVFLLWNNSLYKKYTNSYYYINVYLNYNINNDTNFYIFWHIPFAGFWAKFVNCINSFDPYHNPMNGILLLFSFYRCNDWVLESLNWSSQIVQWENIRIKM